MINNRKDDIGKFMVNLPYPNVNITNPNPCYGQLLLCDYCSCTSELRAVLQYNYHRLRLTELYPDVALALNYICGVEMIHLDLLGEIILQCNCDPKYRTLPFGSGGQSNYYRCTPDCCDYSKTLGKILLENIALEKAQIEQYRRRCTQIPDESITGILKRIILDEELHIEILSGFYGKYCGNNI